MGHTLVAVPLRFRRYVDWAYFVTIVVIIPMLVFYFAIPLSYLAIPYFIGVGAIVVINVTIVCDILFAWWMRLTPYDLPPDDGEREEITALIAAYLPNEKEMSVALSILTYTHTHTTHNTCRHHKTHNDAAQSMTQDLPNDRLLSAEC